MYKTSKTSENNLIRKEENEIMRTAIVYFSLSGTTEYVAKFISGVIGGDLIPLEPNEAYKSGKFSKYRNVTEIKNNPYPVLKHYDFDSYKYDMIIFGTPVWAGKPAPPIMTFIRDNDLHGKRIAYFTTSISGNAEKAFSILLDEISKKEYDGATNHKDEVLKLSVKSPKKRFGEDERKIIEKFCVALIGNFDTEEYWDLYDENRKPVNRVIKRGATIPEGLYHIVVTVWLRDKQGRFLMSKRSEKKRWCPGMWEATGGAVDSGETSIQGDVREVREELGITLYPKNGKLVRSVRSDAMQDFYDVWLFDFDGDIKDIVLQEEEVSEARFMTIEEIDKLWEDGKLHVLLYYYKDLFTT